jgi:uncharacterized Fe-S cluster-containing radical SAM superfamily protein
MAPIKQSPDISPQLPVINTAAFSEHLRQRAIDLEARKVLITRFTGSQEEQDFSVPANCAGFGRIHQFRRLQQGSWPQNPLPIDPAAKALGVAPPDSIRVQVFQNAVCNWRCWYCFVDFELLSADRRYSEFKSCSELLDLYQDEKDAPRVIDLSGGQPDLIPEWTWWFFEELKSRGLLGRVYLWSDDNLSNDYLWRYLGRDQISQMAHSTHYGRVGCFKGFDSESFGFNTQAAGDLFFRQFELMRRLVDADFDVYGYATFTTPTNVDIRGKVRAFMDQLQKIHPLFPLRTVPLLVTSYSPMQQRLDSIRIKALALQSDAVAAWQEELGCRFDSLTLRKSITSHRINQH